MMTMIDVKAEACVCAVWQDFEIAGSGCGAGGAGGGRSPAGTEGTEGTERSWDSHAQYRRALAPRGRALAPLYCRGRVLRSARGLAALGVVACAAAAALCVWAAVGLRAAALPLAPRVQLLQLAALTSALTHAALLAMHVTGLHQLMPIDWNQLVRATDHTTPLPTPSLSLAETLSKSSTLKTNANPQKISSLRL